MLKSSKHVDPRAAIRASLDTSSQPQRSVIAPNTALPFRFFPFSTNNAYLSHIQGAVALTPAYVQLQELGLELGPCGEGACILEPELCDGYLRTFHLQRHSRRVADVDLKSCR